jgi:hypothetical protein
MVYETTFHLDRVKEKVSLFEVIKKPFIFCLLQFERFSYSNSIFFIPAFSVCSGTGTRWCIQTYTIPSKKEYSELQRDSLEYRRPKTNIPPTQPVN